MPLFLTAASAFAPPCTPARAATLVFQTLVFVNQNLPGAGLRYPEIIVL
jgi:hypothetical protein